MHKRTEEDVGRAALDAAGWRTLDEVVAAIAAARNPRVGFAISGGGATGAYQAGVLRAYLRAVARQDAAARDRLRPRVIVGTSAGAINALALLVEELGLADEVVRGSGEEPYVAALWRVIGEKDRGAQFVVGRREWLIECMTRWVKSPWFARLAGGAAAAIALFLVNPVLFGWLASRSDNTLVEGVGEFVLRHPVEFTLAATVALLAALFVIGRIFHRSLFDNRALRGTLANTVGGGPVEASREKRLRRSRTRADEEQIGQRIAARWYAMGEAAPDFILSATDLSATNEALFTLAHPETYHRLAVEQWQVMQIGREAARDPGAYAAPRMLEAFCGAVSESYLLQCVVASTSIPGVFPSQRIELYRADGGGSITHDFVDGGVLNNAPVHIALDAGSTHVISIELNPLVDRGPLHESTRAEGAEPSLVGNLIRTFDTLLTMATGEDIRGAAAWNRRIRAARLAAREKNAPESGPTTVKSEVAIFRVAPETRRVDTIEFDGHYESLFGGASPGLTAWAEQGYTDAAAGRIFWAATYDASPDAPPARA